MKKKRKNIKQTQKNNWKIFFNIYFAVIISIVVITILIAVFLSGNGNNIKTSILDTSSNIQSVNNIEIDNFVPFTLCSVVPHRECIKEKNLLIKNVPYDGEYDVGIKITRGNDIQHYGCQSHEELDATVGNIPNSETILVNDPDQCEDQGTERTQHITLRLKKGNNNIFLKHHWINKNGNNVHDGRESEVINVESLTVEALSIVPTVPAISLEVQEVCAGNPVKITGKANQLFGKIISHRIVKGNNCEDNTKTIHWTQDDVPGLQQAHNWQGDQLEVSDTTNFTNPGSYTIGYTARSINPETNTVNSLGCITKTFQVKNCEQLIGKCASKWSNNDKQPTIVSEEPKNNLCQEGNASPVVSNATSANLYDWSWTCSGPDGLERCYAKMKEMKCGPASEKTNFTSTPTGDSTFFCDFGKLKEDSLHRYFHDDHTNKWEWYCKYPNEGTKRCWAEGPVEESTDNPFCGDGKTNQDNEECDSGENGNGKKCSPSYGTNCEYCDQDCHIKIINGPECGDGETNGDEECDEKENNGKIPTVSYGESKSYCKINCTKGKVIGGECGNGVIENDEGCDLGNDKNGQKCDVNYGEKCEYCEKDCQIKIIEGENCGDGKMNGDEECDNGAKNGYMPKVKYGEKAIYCKSDCTEATAYGGKCGDGKIDNNNEECDDHNLINGDGCSAKCKKEKNKKDKCNSSINSYVWNDVNSNGIREDIEEGISDIEVCVYKDNKKYCSITDSDGYYKIQKLCAGNYKAKVGNIKNMYQTYDPDNKKDGETKVALGKDERYEKANFGYKNKKAPSTGLAINLAILIAISTLAVFAMFIPGSRKNR